ncbi:hypothetical protein [Hyphobacterium marinum]|uniref:Lipoprotein n=1 Tax=Hyphobacterium marinum TaxID=3116574 RepID=A0ABU7LZ70_9PROT|nr:hypothetical protein [Hyphobacterium sp. Y6023]MEE2566864.1 hypothetical protein [Hyphobacterium sp. Y6023]
MKKAIVSAFIVMFATGCAMSGMTSFGNQPTVNFENQSFEFQSAEDAGVLSEVLAVTLYDDEGFIPGDPNWIQVTLRVSNNSDSTIHVTEVRQQLGTGAILQVASSGLELLDQPSTARMVVEGATLSAGGMIVGAFVFPPATLIAGGIGAYRWLSRMDRQERVTEAFRRRSLAMGSLPPGGNITGLVWVPALEDFSGMLVVVQKQGDTRTLILQRSYNDALAANEVELD